MYRSIFTDKKQFLFRFTISYSILIVIILLMGFYFYHLGIEDAKHSLYKQNHSALAQTVNEMDASFRVLNTVCAQISSNSTILRLLKAPDASSSSFYGDAYRAMTYLTTFLSSESIMPIGSFYIYLPYTDYLLSYSFFNDSDLYYRMNNSYNMDYYEEWHSLHQNPAVQKTIVPFDHYSTANSNAFLYIAPVSSYMVSSSFPGKICFEFDRQKLEEIFSGLQLFENGFLYITDAENKGMLSIFADSSCSIEDVNLNMLLEAAEHSDIFSDFRFADQKMVVTSISSDYNGWNYHLVQPADMAFNRLISYQKTYALIIVLACMVSFLIIFFLAKKNVEPIMQIHDALEDSKQESYSLQQTLEAQKPIIYHSYISRIMTGQVSNADELDYIIKYLQIETFQRKFCVLYITAYINEEIESTDRSITYSELLRHLFRQYFGEDILIYEAGLHEYALLLSNDVTQTLMVLFEKLLVSFTRLQEVLNRDYDISIFGGIGNRNADLAYTWKSYQQATEAVEYTGKDNPLQAYFKLNKNNSSYYFPAEFVQRLNHFITSNNEKQVSELLKLIYHENYEERTLPLHMQKWFLSDLRNTLLKIRFTVQATKANEEKLNELDEMLLSKASSFQSISRIALMLTSLFEQKPEGHKLITTIQQYIRENFDDASLCLSKISDEFNISESYFSYLFKAETKENFSEYLERIRMEQAMHLLKTTTIGISTLYENVGYNNANSFRRAFKKVHGVSPKSVRDAAKLEA